MRRCHQLSSYASAFALTAFVAGCGGGSSSPETLVVDSPASSLSLNARNTFTEADYKAGVIGGLLDGRALLFTLESPVGPPQKNDLADQGADEFNFTLSNPTTVDLCFKHASARHKARLYDASGNQVFVVAAQVPSINCAGNAATELTLPVGRYKVRVEHDGKDAVPIVLAAKLTVTSASSTKAAATDRSALSASPLATTTTTTTTIDISTVPAYDITKSYPTAGTLVSSNSKVWKNGWWANAGQCPVQTDCSANFAAGLWTEVTTDSTTTGTGSTTGAMHELAYYAYPTMSPITFPAARPACTKADYGIAAANAAVDAMISSGALKGMGPNADGSFAQTDKDQLYREYMLPCTPDADLTSSTAIVPDNVVTLKSVLTPAMWAGWTSKFAGQNQLNGNTYVDASGNTVPYPVDCTDFDSSCTIVDTTKTYKQFLAAVARYPYFCGEKGFYTSTAEACRREVATFIAHVTQETGEGGDIATSFKALREQGAVNVTPSPYDIGCVDTLDCKTNGFARWYGRGGFQLSYAYNYAGVSAMYYGDYQFLVRWPDLVAYDPRLSFQASLWYYMSAQPPKPSMHAVMMGQYKPSKSCVTAADCHGVIYDAVTGVNNNFNLTIEVQNGGVECRCPSGTATNALAGCTYPNNDIGKIEATHRSTAFYSALATLGATLTAGEAKKVSACTYISDNTPGGYGTIFGDDTLNAMLYTWVDVGAQSIGWCHGTRYGGGAMISVLAPGIIAACQSVNVPTSTVSVQSTTKTGASLAGTISTRFDVSAINVEFGPTTSYGTKVAATPSTVTVDKNPTPYAVAVSATLSDLACNTTYHYRVSATNSAGTMTGSDSTFTTAACI